jgi:hypothetical protein
MAPARGKTTRIAREQAGTGNAPGAKRSIVCGAGERQKL